MIKKKKQILELRSECNYRMLFDEFMKSDLGFHFKTHCRMYYIYEEHIDILSPYARAKMDELACKCNTYIEVISCLCGILVSIERVENNIIKIIDVNTNEEIYNFNMEF